MVEHKHDRLHDVAVQLAVVAGGGSASIVRTHVSLVYPKTREEGAEFLSQIRRMRDAADVALTVATEMQSGLDH
jgi:hypothetical protein